MLSLFLASLALGKVYVLTPPFNFTRPDEIGRWSARGMVTTRKTSLKLVEEPTRERTFLCQRVPYNSAVWEIEMAVSVESGKLHFLFTEDFCRPELRNLSITTWDGIHLVLERTGDRIDVSMLSSNEASNSVANTHLCSFHSEARAPTRIFMQQNGRQVSTFYGNGAGEMQVCGVTSVRIENGYFTFVGEEDANGLGDQSIFSFNVKPINVPAGLARNYSAKNRRSIRATFDYLFKRRTAMLFTSRIEPKLNLSDDSPAGTEMLFHVLSEITDRANLSLNGHDLRQMIETKAGIRLMNAEEKIAKRKRSIDALSDEVDVFAAQLESNLTEIREFVAQQVREVKQAIVEKVESLISDEDTKRFTRFEKTATQSDYSYVIFIVAIIEAAAFIAFFLVRRRQRNNFKID